MAVRAWRFSIESAAQQGGQAEADMSLSLPASPSPSLLPLPEGQAADPVASERAKQSRSPKRTSGPQNLYWANGCVVMRSSCIFSIATDPAHPTHKPCLSHLTRRRKAQAQPPPSHRPSHRIFLSPVSSLQSPPPHDTWGLPSDPSMFGEERLVAFVRPTQPCIPISHDADRFCFPLAPS